MYAMYVRCGINSIVYLRTEVAYPHEMEEGAFDVGIALHERCIFMRLLEWWLWCFARIDNVWFLMNCLPWRVFDVVIDLTEV